MRNKKVTRVLAMLLAGVLCMSCLAGCGGSDADGKGKDKDTKGKKEIAIAYWRAGLGLEWVEAVADAFEEKYPEYYVNIMSSAATSTVKATWEMPDIDEYDVYIAAKHYNTTYMEPLDALLDTTADGDSMTIREKFDAKYLEFEQAPDGHYYTLTNGGGISGLIYNKELFEKAGITQFPRTSDELVAVCDTLYSKKITPMCHFQDGGYYHYMVQLYMNQYSGADYMKNNFYACVGEDGSSPSKTVFTKEDGRYHALKAFEKFITPEYTLLGSNTKSHTEIQTEFLSGRAAIMLNGSWLMNEMKNMGADADKFAEMRIPVLSAIIDNLTTVKNDSQLRKVITAVDQVTSGEKQLSDFTSGDNYVIEGITISKADWDTVYTARNTIAANYAESSVWIPNYASEKEGAMKFLEFLYSDEGYKVYTDTLKLPMPLKLSNGEQIDTSSWNEFEKLQLEYVTTAVGYANEGYSNRHRIFTDGGADMLADVEWVSKFCSQNAEDRMSAQQVWDLIQKTIEDKYEDSWLEDIK